MLCLNENWLPEFNWKPAVKKSYKTKGACIIIPEDLQKYGINKLYLNTLEGLDIGYHGDYIIEGVEKEQYIIRKNDMDFNFNIISKAEPFPLHLEYCKDNFIYDFVNLDRKSSAVNFIFLDTSCRISTKRGNCIFGCEGDALILRGYLERKPTGIYICKKHIFEKTYDIL